MIQAQFCIFYKIKGLFNKNIGLTNLKQIQTKT